MILTQPEIREAIANEGLKFDPPLEEGQFGPTGVDLRLGPQFTIFKKAPGVQLSLAGGIDNIAEVEFYTTHELEEYDQFNKRSVYPLDPGEFVLARTLEKVTIPPHLIASIEGRSSYARLGLSVHQTAPWIHPGFDNQITLEIRNSGPFKIGLTPRIEQPCQLTLFKLSGELPPELLYKGQFQKRTEPFRIKK